MTNKLRSPTVASHPAMCACRQTNANLPRRRKWLKAIFVGDGGSTASDFKV